MKFLAISVLFFVLLSTCNCSFIENFLSGIWKKTRELSLNTNQELKKIPSNVNFELPNENEEFLKDGQKWLNIQEDTVNSCHHRVILSLKKNCNQLSDEEKFKLAIMLINCQLEVEKRQIFTCTPEMSLRQCTLGMNDEFYKIYNMMINRVMAICAALKQEQFKVAVEMTVNRLLQMSQNQASAIHMSLNDQKKINEMAMINIRHFEANNDQIKEKQTKNLEELIKAGNLIEDVTISLQRAFELRQKSQERLLEMEKIASELAKTLERTNNELQQHYIDALEFLANFRSLMDIVSKTVTSIQNSFDHFSSVMKEIGLEITTEFLLSLLFNILYVILGMTLAISLNLKSDFKYIILGLFVFNITSSFCESDIPIIGTNFFIWTVFVTFIYLFQLKAYLIAKCQSIIEYIKLKRENISNNESDDDEVNDILQKIVRERSRSKTPFHESRDDIEMNEIFENQAKMNEIPAKKIRPETPVEPSLRPVTPAILRVMQTDSGLGRSVTPFQPGMAGRVQCQALTQKGAQCRNAAIPGYTKCRVHSY